MVWTANALFGALTPSGVAVLRPERRRHGSRPAGTFPKQRILAAVTLSEVTFGLVFTAVLYLFVRRNDAAGAWRWVGFEPSWERRR